MKYLGTVVILSLLFMMNTACGSLKPAAGEFGQSHKAYNLKFAEQLDQDSKLVKAWFHYTVEELPNGKFLMKKYFPETKQMTHRILFTDKDLSIKDGPATEWYDNGELFSEGNYKMNRKEGEWNEYNIVGKRKSIGKYKNNNKNGLWVAFDFNGIKRNELTYQNNILQGPFKSFDEEGKLVRTGTHLMGIIVSEEYIGDPNENNYEIFELIEELAYLAGCEHKDKALQKACSERKMLENIYSNIRYPMTPREIGIEGSAILNFTIDEDGNMIDLQVLRGVCNDIRKECLRVVKDLPKWRPGKRKGKVVKVNFHLPIRFRLE